MCGGCGGRTAGGLYKDPDPTAEVEARPLDPFSPGGLTDLWRAVPPALEAAGEEGGGVYVRADRVRTS